MTMPAAYSAIKGGLNNLTRYLASYYGKFQIRVNTISPGGIFDDQPDSFVNNYNSKVPLKRMGNPVDIVSAVYYLLSDESSYVTGHNLVVDGGWSII
jgi:NAD(P)-dependent dehydrogenase (short-subunit alcohol dehydrogenase family)